MGFYIKRHYSLWLCLFTGEYEHSWWISQRLYRHAVVSV